MIVLAALLMGGLLVAIEQGKLESRVRVAICEILQLKEDCSSVEGGDGSDQNFLPVYCDAMIKSHSESLSTNIGWFHFGADYSLMWEKLANGEVWVTVVPKDYKAGAHFKVGKSIDAGLDAKLSFGQTYQFQSNAEAQKWMETLKNNLDEHNPTKWRWWNPFDGGETKMKTPVIDARDIGIQGTGKFGFKLPTKKVDLGAGVSGKFSADVINEKWHLWDPKRNRYWDNDSVSFKISGEYNADVSASVQDGNGSAGGHVGGGQQWTATIRYMYNPDGTVANIRWITTYKKQVNGGLSVGPGKGKEKKPGGNESKPSSKNTGKKPPSKPNKGKRSKPKAQKQQGGKKGSKGRKNKKKKVQQNKNNKNQRRQARKQGSSGGNNSNTTRNTQNVGDDGKTKPSMGGDYERGKEVTRMTQLNFDDPNDPAIAKDPLKKAEAQRQQQIAHDYIHKYGGIPPVPIRDAITGKTNAVTEDPGPDADPMTRLMYDKGKSWEWNSDNTKLTRTMIDSQPGHWSMTDETKLTKGAKYLGAPKDGKREYVDFPACTYNGAPSKHNTDLDGY